MKVSALAIFYLAMLALVACDKKTKAKAEFINRTIDRSTLAEQITLSNLIESYESLDGKTIQIEGTTFFEFENVAICAKSGQDPKCFWLDLDKDLPIDDNQMQKLSGQKLIIKGTVDCSSKGHLGAYLATLRNVYFLKVK